MDDVQFDRLTRSMSVGGSRRMLGFSGLAGLASLAVGGTTEGKKRRKKKCKPKCSECAVCKKGKCRPQPQGAPCGDQVTCGAGRCRPATTSDACAECGTCISCETLSSECIDQCREPCLAQQLCRASSNRRDFRALSAFLRDAGFAPTHEPRAYEIFKRGDVVRSFVGIEHIKRGSGQKATLIYVVDASGESAAYAIGEASGTLTFALVLDESGQVTRIDLVTDPDHKTPPRKTRRGAPNANDAGPSRTSKIGCKACQYVCGASLGAACEWALVGGVCGPVAVTTAGLGGLACLLATSAICIVGTDLGCETTCEQMACCGLSCQDTRGCCAQLIPVPGGNPCVDDAHDPSHCGGCYNACTLGEICDDGVCGCGGQTCSAFQQCCGGTCVEPSCPASERFNAETCTCECRDTCGGSCCSEGLECCGEQCVALPSDHENCGSCGKACPFDAACIDGECLCTPDGRPTCTDDTCCAYFQECCADDCVYLEADPDHCGECHHRCGDCEACVNGVCKDTCTGCQTCQGGTCVDPVLGFPSCARCEGTSLAYDTPCGDGCCNATNAQCCDAVCCRATEECCGNGCCAAGACDIVSSGVYAGVPCCWDFSDGHSTCVVRA